jgi:hypothetical protein
VYLYCLQGLLEACSNSKASTWTLDILSAFVL